MLGFLSSIKLLRVMISFSLVFWIAGFGCIFGCESQAMTGAETHRESSEPTAGTIVSGASCHHKAVEHSCCSKRGHSANKTPDKGRLSDLLPISGQGGELAGGMHECPMGLNAKALGTKPRTDKAATAIALEPIDLPLFNAVQVAATPPPSFLNNRGHTYLRCCVFLI